jgi:hypothetical protein
VHGPFLKELLAKANLTLESVAIVHRGVLRFLLEGIVLLLRPAVMAFLSYARHVPCLERNGMHLWEFMPGILASPLMLAAATLAIES